MCAILVRALKVDAPISALAPKDVQRVDENGPIDYHYSVASQDLSENPAFPVSA